MLLLTRTDTYTTSYHVIVGSDSWKWTQLWIHIFGRTNGVFTPTQVLAMERDAIDTQQLDQPDGELYPPGQTPL